MFQKSPRKDVYVYITALHYTVPSLLKEIVLIFYKAAWAIFSVIAQRGYIIWKVPLRLCRTAFCSVSIDHVGQWGNNGKEKKCCVSEKSSQQKFSTVDLCMTYKCVQHLNARAESCGRWTTYCVCVCYCVVLSNSFISLMKSSCHDSTSRYCAEDKNRMYELIFCLLWLLMRNQVAAEVLLSLYATFPPL